MYDTLHRNRTETALLDRALVQRPSRIHFGVGCIGAITTCLAILYFRAATELIRSCYFWSSHLIHEDGGFCNRRPLPCEAVEKPYTVFADTIN